jgi:hypothetical protein
VAVVMGDQRWEICRALGEAIAPVLADGKTIVVASSDLSHFYDDATARRLDRRFCDLFTAMDPRRLEEALARREVEACGGGPAVAAQIASLEAGADRAEILATANSGDVTGDRTSVVGYAAGVMWISESDGRDRGAKAEVQAKGGSSTDRTVEEGSTAAPPETFHLNETERDYLLRLARWSIASRLGIDHPRPERPASKILERPSGAFVTLKIAGRLRGCIGYIEAIEPLERTVEKMARAAAFEDPRFPPLAEEEFDRIHIEISVLSPLRPIRGVEDVQVGRDGLVVERGFQRGLLLPQVATEYGWDAETFLEQTCRKAGLPTTAWQQPGTKLWAFSAEIFAEPERR